MRLEVLACQATAPVSSRAADAGPSHIRIGRLVGSCDAIGKWSGSGLRLLYSFRDAFRGAKVQVAPVERKVTISVLRRFRGSWGTAVAKCSVLIGTIIWPPTRQ